MKKLIIFLILGIMTSFSTNMSAQKSAKDIINIKEKVSEKINELQKPEIKKSNDKDLLSSPPLLSKESFIKSFVFVEGTLLILIGITLKRRYHAIKKYQVSQLKANIRKLRAEKIGSIFNVANYKLRKQLRMQPINISGSEITKRAKKYSISKGEIHLALKINMMQSSR